MRNVLDCGRQFVTGSRLKCHPNLLRVRQKRHGGLRQIDSELDSRCIEQTQNRLSGLHRLEVLSVAGGNYAIERSGQLDQGSPAPDPSLRYRQCLPITRPASRQPGRIILPPRLPRPVREKRVPLTAGKHRRSLSERDEPPPDPLTEPSRPQPVIRASPKAMTMNVNENNPRE